MVIEKSLQRLISVDAHDEQFVQCVSPTDIVEEGLSGSPALPDLLIGLIY